MRQRIEREMDEKYTPKVMNDNLIKLKSLLQNNILFKDAVVLPPHSLLRILSHYIAPDSAFIGSDSMGQRFTTTCTLK